MQGVAATSTHCADRLVGVPVADASQASEMVDQDLVKAHALGNALLVSMVVPWGLCLLFYTGGPS